GAPSLRSTAFAGDINIVGDLNLFPSSSGTLELAASGGVIGVHPTGRPQIFPGGQFRPVTVLASASVNLSDAEPSSLPGITSPLSYRNFVPNTETDLSQSAEKQFANVNPAFQETGSFAGAAAGIDTQQALHGRSLLHAADTEPVRVYAMGGDISAFTLFTPKSAQILADNDINDVAFYIQNTSPGSISVVSAGRDIIAFNENYRLRSNASDIGRGNLLSAAEGSTTVLGTNTAALA